MLTDSCRREGPGLIGQPLMSEHAGAERPIRNPAVVNCAALVLADGSIWEVEGEGTLCGELVELLRHVMRMGPVRSIATGRVCLAEGRLPWRTHPSDRRIVLVDVPAPLNEEAALAQVMLLGTLLGLQAASTRGMLLHGALAEWQGRGVVLVGPSGSGKTTASARLNGVWRSLSDDEILVVRDESGRYWAHPWPTWSRWMSGELASQWDVQHAVPLEAVFFLHRAALDRGEAVGRGFAATLLVESAEEAGAAALTRLELRNARTYRLECLARVCALVGSVPCYRLGVSSGGPFWREMERAMGESGAA
jgi:SynChlorMet cassette protein ScmC